MLAERFIFVFDKDGVITNTEHLKLRLLEEMLSADFPHLSSKITTFSQANRGMYRVNKIEAIFKSIVGRPITREALQNYLQRFVGLMQQKLPAISLIPGVAEFIKRQHCIQFVSSAAPIEEVESHLNYFRLSSSFSGVYASPNYTNKTLAIKEIQEQYQKEIIFFGDSLSDYNYAIETGVHFFGITYCSNAFDNLPNVKLLHDFKDAYGIIQASIC